MQCSGLLARMVGSSMDQPHPQSPLPALCPPGRPWPAFCLEALLPPAPRCGEVQGGCLSRHGVSLSAGSAARPMFSLSFLNRSMSPSRRDKAVCRKEAEGLKSEIPRNGHESSSLSAGSPTWAQGPPSCAPAVFPELSCLTEVCKRARAPFHSQQTVTCCLGG